MAISSAGLLQSVTHLTLGLYVCTVYRKAARNVLPGCCSSLIQELQQSRRSGFLSLAVGQNVPVFGARQAFFQIPGGGRCVRGVTAGNDQGGDVHLQHVLRLSARRRVAVEERAAHASDERLVLF